MASHETDLVTTAPKSTGPEPAKVLIVGGDPEFRADLSHVLNEGVYQSTHVNRYDEARAALGKNRYDVILLSPKLPDGNGLDLARLVQQRTPSTKTIVFSETNSFPIALEALRSGAVDYIRTSAGLDEFRARVEAASEKCRTERRRDDRLRKLQQLCHDLNSAREEIAEQVDSLCSELADAYQELTDQMGEVAMASEFRTLLRQELDIEDLLRTTLEYLLGKTGPTNAAVFLPDSDNLYSLGAYVNYDCPRDSIDRLLDHLCHAICPQMADESELVAFSDADEFAEWMGIDGGLLAESQVIAFACRHKGECLAIFVLFRNLATPFEPQLAGTLDVLRQIFGEQLAQVLNVHHRATPQWPKDADEGFDDYDDYGFGFGGGGGGVAA
ncbi:MAG: GAF domain-containing protein [Planctomycetota bacterium]|jgi:DNA-binding response OmpR family regulator